MQEYLIIMPDGEVFSTNWFDAENHFTEGSTVINIISGEYTNNGVDWKEIKEDHL